MQLINTAQFAERASIDLPRSKSISNRLLIAQALSHSAIQLNNLSDAADTNILKEALTSNSNTLDVGMAGTAYRFLTAYYAQSNKEILLKGAKRMYHRPIGPLVDGLRELGASIEYLKKDKFPPLAIAGKKLQGGEVHLEGSISSQFITAILLIAPYLDGGLKLKIVGELVSKPYVQMTLTLMQKLGVKISDQGNSIKVKEGKYESTRPIQIEKDWSSAAFFYQWVALSGKEICLRDMSLDSIQGDLACVELFEQFGVKTIALGDDLVLCPSKNTERLEINLEMGETPDLIPSMIVTAAFLSKKCSIRGVKTLRIKESDRIIALKKELAKFNAMLHDIGEDEIRIEGSKRLPDKLTFNTYNDHRIAMCLAPVAARTKELKIKNPEVVSKSFPSFWKEFKKLGLRMQS